MILVIAFLSLIVLANLQVSSEKVILTGIIADFSAMKL